MKIFAIRTMALVAIVALVAFGGCSDDDPAAPPGGGGGSSGLTLPAGVYNTSVVVTTCSGTPVINDGSTETWCSSELVDELPPGLDCSTTVVNADSVTVNCSGTDDVGGGCTISWTAIGSGTRVGDTWTLNVRVEVSNQNPPDCFNDSTCLDMVLTAEKIEDPPTACAYADANTFNSTITGGPMAGKVPFIMGGGSSSGPGGIVWSFGGSYPEQIFIAASSAGLAQGWSIGFDLNAIDPKSLPFTANIFASSGQANSAGQGDGFVYYNESDPDTGHNAFASGGGGTVTVQEISNQHIAGTISLDILVTTYTGPQASAAQETSPRTISGGFFILQEGPRAEQSFAASLAQRMLQSLRGTVE